MSTKRNLKSRKYLVLNRDDESLKPFVVFLPKPPLDKYVDGRDLPIKDQVFRKTEYPIKLKNLEDSVNRKLMEKERRSSTFRRTKQKFIYEMWEALKSSSAEYKNEIEFLKREQFRLKYGYWVAIEGDAIFINPWHYRYLNYWTIDDVEEVEFRFRDWEYFSLHWWAFHTTMNQDNVDMGRRTILGIIYPKHRRDGATHKSLDILYSMTIEFPDKLGGIQSFDKDNAKEHFREKLVPAFDKMKFFCKPYWEGASKPAGELRFNATADISTDYSLSSRIVPATTASKSFFDGKKQVCHLSDENGKTTLEDVVARWEVVRHTLSEGLGSKLLGFALIPTTVEDMNSGGGKPFMKLCNMSMYHDRNPTSGQTKTGLITYFRHAADGRPGFIDKFGKSVIQDPKENEVWRLKEIKRDNNGKLIGAMRDFMGQRAELLKENSVESLSSYVEMMRKFPLEYVECFGGAEGNAGFDTVAVKSRINEILSDEINGIDTVRKGNFYWRIGDQLYSSEDFIAGQMHMIQGITDDAEVVWKDEDSGKWNLSYMPTSTNNRVKKGEYFAPSEVDKFLHSGDPFQFLDDPQLSYLRKNDKSNSNRRSKGSLATFMKRDMSIDPVSKDVRDWETHRFVLSYVNRPRSTEIFGEDAIMQCVFFGGLMFPENNLTNLFKYFIDRGFRGYLLYQTDVDGKFKTKPGFTSLSGSKQQLFQKVNTYITNHITRERHIDILYDILHIQGLKDMTNRDLFVAAAGCLYGLESKQPEYMKRSGETKDIDEWLEFETF